MTKEDLEKRREGLLRSMHQIEGALLLIDTILKEEAAKPAEEPKAE